GLLQGIVRGVLLDHQAAALGQQGADDGVGQVRLPGLGVPRLDAGGVQTLAEFIEHVRVVAPVLADQQVQLRAEIAGQQAGPDQCYVVLPARVEYHQNPLDRLHDISLLDLTASSNNVAAFYVSDVDAGQCLRVSADRPGNTYNPRTLFATLCEDHDTAR